VENVVQVNAPFVVEHEMLLPAKKDKQALVPCNDVEQRTLDRTFQCGQNRGMVPALKSVKIPVSINHLLTIKLSSSSSLSTGRRFSVALTRWT